MSDRIGKVEFARMARGAARRIREKHLWLSELDSLSGDGDHGTTMLRIVDRLEQVCVSSGMTDFKTCFQQAGWSVLAADGGASSALIGSFFLGMADVVVPDVLVIDCPRFAGVLEGGIVNVSEQTPARPGDKTLMDALVPCVKSFSEAANAGREIKVALKMAADSAKAGAQATEKMIARHGRARLLGERTRGHADPGATSIALLFEGFYSGFIEAEGEWDNA